MDFPSTWPTIRAIVIPVACIVVAAGAGALVELILTRKVSKMAYVRGHAWLFALVDALEAGMLFWSTALGIHIALTISSAPAKIEHLLDETLLVLVLASVTIIGARLAANTVHRFTRGTGEQIASATLLASVASGVVVVIGFLITLSSLGIAITPLLTALGVGGLAVALALQPPLANLFSGLQLVASRQIRPGDYIALPSGQQGFVEDINWRSISIRESANNLVVVPNLVLAQELFINYRLPEPRVAVRVPLRVAYGSDLTFVEKLALDAVSRMGEEINDPRASHEPYVRVHEFADTTINLSVNFFVRRAVDQERASSEYLRRLYELMQQHGVESPAAGPIVPHPEPAGRG
ncbi:MAG TPA: mechanosensitive ion channel family protein [Candidatus Baltobacteraceae bacterium]|nr:mechanosensitive ion channel family protein [Candidatus Baltobacteraceae bacterium]